MFEKVWTNLDKKKYVKINLKEPLKTQKNNNSRQNIEIWTLRRGEEKKWLPEPAGQVRRLKMTALEFLTWPSADIIVPILKALL